LELHITVAARARREDLNVLVVLRAMGCQSDAEALLHIGAEPAFEPLLAATLQDARQPGQPGHQRNTQAAALEWLGAARAPRPAAAPRLHRHMAGFRWWPGWGSLALRQSLREGAGARRVPHRPWAEAAGRRAQAAR